MLSQSGANAGAIIEGLGRRGLRFSKGVSYGNAADLRAHDFLDYALHDPATELVVAYIEGPRDGRAFFEALRRLARVKPTIVLKGGISEDGARAARSHTGSLAGSIEVFDALCRQAGAMRVRTLDDLLDLAVAATSELRGVQGRRVTLIGAGGGYAVLSSDQMAMEGLQVPWLPEDVQEALHEFIPIAGTSVRNPVDANFGPRPSDGLPRRSRADAPSVRADRESADHGPDLHHRGDALEPGPRSERGGGASGGSPTPPTNSCASASEAGCRSRSCCAKTASRRRAGWPTSVALASSRPSSGPRARWRRSSNGASAARGSQSCSSASRVLKKDWRGDRQEHGRPLG